MYAMRGLLKTQAARLRNTTHAACRTLGPMRRGGLNTNHLRSVDVVNVSQILRGDPRGLGARFLQSGKTAVSAPRQPQSFLKHVTKAFLSLTSFRRCQACFDPVG